MPIDATNNEKTRNCQQPSKNSYRVLAPVAKALKSAQLFKIEHGICMRKFHIQTEYCTPRIINQATTKQKTWPWRFFRGFCSALIPATNSIIYALGFAQCREKCRPLNPIIGQFSVNYTKVRCQRRVFYKKNAAYICNNMIIKQSCPVFLDFVVNYWIVWLLVFHWFWVEHCF